MADGCIIASRDGVGIIELARPDKYNCISLAMLDSILAGARAFEETDDIRVVLIRGQGRNFCVGADLVELKSLRQSASELKQFLELGNSALNLIESLSKPVVAAVQGYCLAGGLELALACDLVIASEDSQFGDQHAEFGLYPGWGGARRMARLFGPRRSFDLMATARRIDARTAEAWGLANQVVDNAEIEEESWRVCKMLSARSAVGLLEMKKAVLRESSRLPFDGGSNNIDISVNVIMGEDATEGIVAFEERRPPIFLGRSTEPTHD